MRKTILILSCFLALIFASCQKEIDWSVPGSDGDLLVKVLQLTPATNDTNTITFQWDANKRLLQYKSAGKVNGTATNINHVISRLTDGKIKKIISKSSLMVGFIDSTVYEFRYTPGGTQWYVIDTQYTIIGKIADSSAFTYNTAGQVTAKETYTDFFGGYTPSAKETYQYDANGNMLTRNVFEPDGAGGYDAVSTTTFTYDTHKSGVTLGEESYVIISPENISKFNATKSVTNAVVGNSYTSTFSQQSFNSFNRPSKATLKMTPQPPGYDLKLVFFYQ